MNYEQFRAQATVETQMLLSPVAVNLSKDEFNALCDNMDLLSQCGFEAEPFGDGAVIVRAVPSLVGDSDVKDLICEIAEKLLEHKTDITPDKSTGFITQHPAEVQLRRGTTHHLKNKDYLSQSCFQCRISDFAHTADPCL